MSLLLALVVIVIRSGEDFDPYRAYSCLELSSVYDIVVKPMHGKERQQGCTDNDERSIYEVAIRFDFCDLKEKLKSENIQARA